MTIVSLLIISGSCIFGIIWIIHYLPILSKRPKTIWLQKNSQGKFAWTPQTIYIPWSPRLFACKLLIPSDIGITLFLILGGILGLTMVTGIQLMVFNVLVAVGFSFGVGIINKIFVPRWKKQYDIKYEEFTNSLNSKEE